MTLSYRENTYNEFNQLIKTVDNEGNTSTYTYLLTGLRWSKNVNGTETKFLWDGDNVYAEMDSNNIATNVYTRGVDLIKNNSNTFYLKNAHGDITQLADVNGTVTKNYEYDAFGNESETDSTDTNPFRYCGEYFDDETGYIYLRNRYYNPDTGSFISEDPVKDGSNWYAYCCGDPVNFVDPSGYKLAEYSKHKSGMTDEKYIEIKSQTVEYLMELTNRNVFLNKNSEITIGCTPLHNENEYRTQASRQLISRIINSDKLCYLTIGKIESGSWMNPIKLSNGNSAYWANINVDELEKQFVKTPAGLILEKENVLSTIVHELSHVDQAMRGVVSEGSKDYSIKYNGHLRTFNEDLNELETVGIIKSKDPLLISENDFRTQFGYYPRAVYTPGKVQTKVIK